MATIAVVCADTAARQARLAQLEARGYRVEIFNTFERALLLLEQPPDLVIASADLPGGTGLELVAQIRRQSLTHLPVLFLVEGDEDSFMRGYAAGASDCLDQGVTEQVLAAKVARLLGLACEKAPTPPKLPGAGDLLFERYRIRDVLGEGSFGAVFDAVDEQEKRGVALKILFGGVGLSQEDQERFLREAYTLGAVQSDYVVEIVEFGKRDDYLYCAMERVDGVSVKDQVLRTGPCPEPQLIAMLIGMAQALTALEDKDLVHRDIKPDNIMLRDGRYEAPVLVDFGLAKTTFDAGVTSPDVILGSPGYMPPEQLEGPADKRGDLFSLGQVAIFAGLGKEAFPNAGGMELVVRMSRVQTPIPDRLSSGLQDILRVLTDLSPALRYPSARTLLAELRALGDR